MGTFAFKLPDIGEVVERFRHLIPPIYNIFLKRVWSYY